MARRRRPPPIRDPLLPLGPKTLRARAQKNVLSQTRPQIRELSRALGARRRPGPQHHRGHQPARAVARRRRAARRRYLRRRPPAARRHQHRIGARLPRPARGGGVARSQFMPVAGPEAGDRPRRRGGWLRERRGRARPAGLERGDGADDGGGDAGDRPARRPPGRPRIAGRKQQEFSKGAGRSRRRCRE